MKRLTSLFSLALILALLVSTLPTKRVYAVFLVVDTLSDTFTLSCTPGNCSLRDAIFVANWNGQPDIITFNVDGTINLNPLLGALWVGGDTLPNSTTIDGSGRNITIVASGTPAIQFVTEGHTLQNLTVQGSAGPNEPLIDVLANRVTIRNVTVQNNANGPGIQFSNNLTNVTSGDVINSTIRNNTGGSGILIYDATGIIIQNSFIHGNGRNGIAISGSTLPITSNVLIDGNTIYSNTFEGINLWGSSDNIIQNNYIGTDSTSAILGNSSSGIAIANGSSNNTIQNNRIAYNAYQNILVDGNGTSNNIIRNNHIYSGACRNPAVNNNTGIIITNGATNNIVGPGNRIECHWFDGVQVVGTGTDNNEVVDNNSTFNATGPFGSLAASIQRNGRGISVINAYGTQPFPAIGPTNPGPNNTTIRRNDIENNNSDGIYAVRSTNVNIGGAAANANNIRNNSGNGILIVGSTGYIQNNQVTGNGADGARIEPHYGPDPGGRDPATFSDDVISQFDIRDNNFANNIGAGIHGLDNEADSDDDPPALNANNTFSNNVRARVVQEWFGAVELLDASNNPISSGLTSSSVSSATCGSAGTLQQYDSGAWGPSNNGLGYGAFSMTNVGTWFLILDDYVNNGGSYVNCEPYTVSASTATLSGSALFSFDGNATTHPVAPDPGIPYARPTGNRNSRYQVAQVTLQTPPAPPPSSSGSALPSTGFPMGRITSLPVQPAEKVYTTYDELILEIPSLGIEAPIVGVPKSGNAWDVSWLGNSVGWLEGSAFPTWAGNTVLTGHVWNADNTPGIFAQIKNLKYGDRFYIYAFGQTYVYEVRENQRLWGSSNIAKVFKHEEYDWVTLLTCEGYNPLTGNYLFRRIVRAVLMQVK